MSLGLHRRATRPEEEPGVDGAHPIGSPECMAVGFGSDQ